MLRICLSDASISEPAYVAKCLIASTHDITEYRLPSLGDQNFSSKFAYLLHAIIVKLLSAWDTILFSAQPLSKGKSSLESAFKWKQIADFHLLLSGYESAKSIYGSCRDIFKSEDNKLWAVLCSEGLLKTEVALLTLESEDSKNVVKKLHERVVDCCSSLTKCQKPFLAYLMHTEFIESLTSFTDRLERLQYYSLIERYITVLSSEEIDFALAELSCIVSDNGMWRKTCFINNRLMQRLTESKAIKLSIVETLKPINGLRGKYWTKIDQCLLQSIINTTESLEFADDLLLLLLTLLFKCADSLAPSQQQDILTRLQKRTVSQTKPTSSADLKTFVTIFERVEILYGHSPLTSIQNENLGPFLVSSLKHSTSSAEMIAIGETFEARILFQNPLERPLLINKILLKYLFGSNTLKGC